MIDWLVATNGGVVPLILRLTLAVVMFPHGAQKTLGWFGGYGFRSTMASFAILEHELAPGGAGDGEVPAVDGIERAAEQSDVHDPVRMAASTLAGVKGTDRRRTPIASKTALAMAAGTTAAAGSPAPHGFSVGRSTSSRAIAVAMLRAGAGPPADSRAAGGPLPRRTAWST